VAMLALLDKKIRRGYASHLKGKKIKRAIAQPSETLPIPEQNFALNRVISIIQ